jgi:hypothetical protein
MPKIINEFASGNPLAEALQGFASSFGGNTAQTELYRQKALGLGRENTNIPLLADAVTGNNPALTARLGIMSGVDPKVTGGYRQYYGVQKYGPGSSEATRDTMSVPGANYGHTVAGTQASEANRTAIENLRTQRGYDAARFKVDNTPTNVLVDGIPTVVPQSEAMSSRMQPVLPLTQVQGGIAQTDAPTMTPEQRAAAGGYAPKNPANVWVYKRPDGSLGNTVDARTDTQTGQPITGPAMKLEGANTEGLSGDSQVNHMLLKARVNKDQAVAMLDRLATTLSQPNADQSVGFLGTLARGFNDLRAQSEATVRLFGGELSSQAFSSPENRAAVDGVMQQVFGNPQITAKAQALGINSAIIRSQVQDLAYMIAKTQDPSGRVSADDIRRASETVAGTIMDPKSSVAVLNDLKTRVVQSHDIFERNTRAMYPGVNRGAAPAPAEAAQPATTQPAPSGVIRYDAQGNRVQ